MGTYNRAGLIARAVRSVLSQTRGDFEFLIVDDASADGTWDYLQTLPDGRVRCFRHAENLGLAAARNTALEHARGRFVSFIDDDDEWLPRKLEKQLPKMEAAPGAVGLNYCWMDYFDARGRLVHEVHPRWEGEVFDKVIDRQRLGGSPTWLARRSAAEEAGRFDASLRRGVDGDFLRRLCLRYRVECLPEVLVKVHTGHGHRRLSEDDPGGIRAHIYSQELKLVKFRKQLERLPKQRSAIHSDLAASCRLLGDWPAARRHAATAAAGRPLSLRAYRMLFLVWVRRGVKRAPGREGPEAAEG